MPIAADVEIIGNGARLGFGNIHPDQRQICILPLGGQCCRRFLCGHSDFAACLIDLAGALIQPAREFIAVLAQSAGAGEGKLMTQIVAGGCHGLGNSPLSAAGFESYLIMIELIGLGLPEDALDREQLAPVLHKDLPGGGHARVGVDVFLDDDAPVHALSPGAFVDGVVVFIQQAEGAGDGDIAVGALQDSVGTAGVHLQLQLGAVDKADGIGGPDGRAAAGVAQMSAAVNGDIFLRRQAHILLALQDQPSVVVQLDGEAAVFHHDAGAAARDVGIALHHHPQITIVDEGGLDLPVGGEVGLEGQGMGALIPAPIGPLGRLGIPGQVHGGRVVPHFVVHMDTDAVLDQLLVAAAAVQEEIVVAGLGDHIGLPLRRLGHGLELHIAAIFLSQQQQLHILAFCAVGNVEGLVLLQVG